MANDMEIVQFTAGYQGYNVGEKASFHKDLAARLCQANVAKRPEAPRKEPPKGAPKGLKYKQERGGGITKKGLARK